MADTSIVYNVFAKFHGDDSKMQKFGRAAVVVGAAVGALAVKFGVDGVRAASDLNETINKSNVIFGQNAKAMEKWAGGAATRFGLSKAAALDAASGFGNMFSQLGFAGDESAKMSRSVVKLSADLGSFNNLPTAEVSEMIAASFRGEYDSLQRLIPNINAARVQQEAMTMTGKKSADQLTAQEKAAATLAIVQRDGAAANNDFARTSGGLANQQKILRAEYENVSASLGTNLLPVMVKLAGAFVSTIGFVQRNSGVLGPLASIIGVVAVGLWAMTAAQTALNVAMALNPIGLVVIAIAALAAGFIYAYRHSETFRNIVNGVMRAVVAGVGNGVGFIIDAFHSWLNVWLTVADAMISGAAKALGWIPGLGGKLKKANEAFDTWRTGLNATLDGLAADARGWGGNVAEGLASGISAKSYLAIAAAGDMANKVAAMTRQQLKVSSPSQVAIEIGQFFAEGVGVGIKDKTSGAIEAVQALTDKVIAKLAELRQKAADIRSSAAGAVTGMFSFGSIGAEGASPVQQFADAATQAQAFAGATSRTAASGLDPRILAQAVGTGNLTVVQALANLDPSGTASVNASYALADTMAARVGATILSTTPLPEQIAREQGQLDTLKEIRADLKAQRPIEIHVHDATDPDAVVAAIRRYIRRNGLLRGVAAP